MKPETQFLVQKLRDAKQGELLTYSALSEAIGGDVRTPANRSRLGTARQIVANDYGLVFEVVHGVGCRLVAKHDVARMAQEKGIRGTERVVHTWGNTLATVNLADLDEQGQKTYMQSATRMAIVAASATDQAYKSFESQAIKPGNAFKFCKEDVLAAIAYGVS